MSEHAATPPLRKTRKAGARVVRLEMTEAEAAEAQRLLASFDRRLDEAEMRIDRVLHRLGARPGS